MLEYTLNFFTRYNKKLLIDFQVLQDIIVYKSNELTLLLNELQQLEKQYSFTLVKNFLNEYYNFYCGQEINALNLNLFLLSYVTQKDITVTNEFMCYMY